MHNDDASSGLTCLEPLAAVIATRMALEGDTVLARFLERGEEVGDSLTGTALDRAGRAIAAGLLDCGFANRRIVLMFDPGLDVLRALIGCLYAGAIAVPAPRPRPGATLERVDRIVRTSDAACILTSAALTGKIAIGLAQGDTRWMVPVIAIEDLLLSTAAGDCPGFDRDPAAPCIVQYTSGSTTDPRGAVLSGSNLLANVALATRGMNACQGSLPDCFVNWMPYYHDLGLVGNMVIPLVTGARTVHMSPHAFVQRPVRWLKAISTFRGRVSGGPGFAFDLCTDRVTDEEIAGLDLSCWEVAFAGAEPIMLTTMNRFADRFAAAGLRRSSVLTVYGLAETCLYAGGSHGDFPRPSPDDPTIRAPVRLDADAQSSLRIVRDGRVVDGGVEGEIWLGGASVSAGYLEREEENEAGFRARLDPDDGGRYLRTGDVGTIVDGILTVRGRIKDVLIRHGVNFAAVDVERIALRDQPLLDDTGAAAIQHAGDGRIALIVERRRGTLAPDHERTIRNEMRRRVGDALGLNLDEIAIVPRATLPRTTSGKLRRAHIGALWFDGHLAPLETAA